MRQLRFITRRTLLIQALAAYPLLSDSVERQTPAPKASAPLGPPSSAQPNASSLTTAVVTAAVTIAGIVLKDFIFKLLEERRANQRTESAVYERYSRPLSASATSLLFPAE
jgi:hypothetical protein